MCVYVHLFARLFELDNKEASFTKFNGHNILAVILIGQLQKVLQALRSAAKFRTLFTPVGF